MCGCSSKIQPKKAALKSSSYTGECNRDLSYYISLFETLSIMEPNSTVNLLKSMVKSQINVYDRNCIMFESQIEELKPLLNL